MLSKTNRSTDIVLVLKPGEEGAKNSSGMLDKRLFTGENTVHVMQDPQVGLWQFKYDMGMVPGGLKQRFTSYNAAIKYARDYFKKRNVSIVEERD